MKSLKYILMFLVAAVTFTACQEEWAPGAPDSPASVYFSADTRDVTVAKADKSVELTVYRATAGDALTVDLLAAATVDDAPVDLFTLPTRVSFAEGEAESKVTIGFNGEDLEYAVPYVISLQVKGEEYQSNYGPSSVTFAITLPEPWKSLGKGIYRDDFLAPMYGGPSGVMVEVEIVQHELEPNRYRMVEPFSQAMCPYIIGGVPEDMIYTDPGYVELVVDDAGNVEIPSSPLGFKLDVGTGNGPEDFYLATLEDGKFEDGVFWFTTPKSIMWHIPDGRGNYANNSGLFAVALPGYQISDYSITAAYGGMIVEADNATTSAVVNFAVGADVESYKFTVLPGNVTDIAPVIEGIVAGSEELTIFEAEASQLTWKLSLEPAQLYTLVAVPYSTEAEVDDALVFQFYFPGMGGQELPEPEFEVYYESVASLTGNDDYEAQFPAAYFVALGIVGNADEMKSISAWIGDAAVAAGSGMDDATIIAQYGMDLSDSIADIKEKGSAVLGPYNMPSGSTSVALVAIETVYGNTQYFHVEHTLPNVTGFALGSYNMTDTLEGEEYGLGFYLTGGLADGQLIAEIDGFQFLGLIDAEKKTVVFDGTEINDNKDYIQNTFLFYYDQAKTMAFGYFAASDAEFKTPADLTFSYEGDKIVGLETYFASCVFSLESEDTPFLGYDFYFSPEAVIEYTEAPADEEQPETSAMKASVMSLGAELQFGTAPATPIFGEVYNGTVNREFVSNATIGF